MSKYEVVKTPGRDSKGVAAVVYHPTGQPEVVVMHCTHVAVAKDFAFILNAANEERQKEAEWQTESIRSSSRSQFRLPT